MTGRRIYPTLLMTMAALSATAILHTSSAQTAVSNAQTLFTDERKGNCAACHKLPGDTAINSISNLGPALVNLKTRYPDRAKLRAVIWDNRQADSSKNAQTIMPPYGKNRILTEAEIDTLVRYLETM